jgi:hypothetical protein
MAATRLAGKPSEAGVKPQQRPSAHFDLVSHWCIPAPVATVWDALVAVRSWPRWWPYVRSVQTLREAGPDGLGAVRTIQWRTRLGYALVTTVEAVESIKHERLRGRACGSLAGEGIWLLRAEGETTHLTYVWRVTLTQAWMRWTAPLLAPLFRWSHESVMRAGEAGLCAYLASKPTNGP